MSGLYRMERRRATLARTLPHWWVALAVAIGLLALACAEPVAAQTADPEASTAAAEEPTEIRELRRLLASQAVQDWLAETPPPAAETTARERDVEDGLSLAVQRMAERRALLAEALPNLPGEMAAALGRLTAYIAAHGILLVALMLGGLVAVGLAAEWRFMRVTRNLRKSVLGSREDTIGERLKKLGQRLMLALSALAIFSVATLGALALLPMPERVEAVAWRILVAVILFRGVLLLLRIVLAPNAPERRVVPLPDALAAFWMPRLATLAGILIVGWTTIWFFRLLDLPPASLRAIALLFGFVLAITALVILWQRRHDDPELPQPTLARNLAWSGYVILTFGLWFVGLDYLTALVLITGLLLLSINVVNRAVNHLLREVDDPEGAGGTRPPSVTAAVIERGARSVLILTAGAALFWSWGVGFDALVTGEVRGAALIRVVIYLIVVLAIFDFIWHVARTAIDTYIEAAPDEDGTAEEKRRRARLRTVLPILRSTLQVTLVVIALLMALSALGMNVGPLIAGAGVMGAAIAFGSQSLVRDVVSGVFYLLDDAFRVGEYIIVDKAKGTVESFSIRSVQLRHHRGAVYTIPFGSLGAIQNVSRDWVIVKLGISVPFGTDLGKVKKVVKGVSAELLEDPELGPAFLEPLKSQGADEISDHGITVRIKFMAKPGQQFTIRRRANALLEQRLKEAGITLAYPTVRVIGHDDDAGADAAAAQAAIVAAKHAGAERPA